VGDGQLLACSWSGGKDSAYAFYNRLCQGWRPGPLITMLTEDGERSRSHGIHKSVLEAQAQRIGAPLVVRATTWSDYEDAFIDALREAFALGANDCAFGDIDFEENRAWEERVCTSAGMTAHIPLWKVDREDYVARVVADGFRCKLIAIKQGVLPKELLGRELDRSLVDELKSYGVDLAGEAGEYHTLLVASPIFDSSVDLLSGDAILRDGVWFQDQRLLPKSGRVEPAEGSTMGDHGGGNARGGDDGGRN
jgi:diphthine-ammonia ligase